MKVLNPAKSVFGSAEQLVVPPSGIVAGVFARTDSAQPGGVYDPPAGIVIDLSHVNYVGSVFVSFLLRCHTLAKRRGSEIVLAGVSQPARELLQVLGLETIWAIYPTRKEALEALSGTD